MWKYFRTVCYLTILLNIVFTEAARGAEGRDDEIIRIAVSPSGFNGINNNDAEAALKAWAESVGKEMGLFRVDVTLLSNPVYELREALKEDRLDGISINVPEYMDIGLKVSEVYIGISENAPEISYALIVGKNAGISSIEDLPGRKLVMGQDRRMNLAQPWLKVLMADRNEGTDKTTSLEPVNVENLSKAIFQVFFQQADAALVVSEAFDLACELNPQLRNRVRAIAESQPFVIGFFVFPQKVGQSPKRKKLAEAILDLSSSPGGRQVLTVFKSTRIKKYPVSVLDGTIQFVEHYRRIMSGTSPLEVQP